MIAARCTESTSGARNVENILSRTLLPELSGEVLSRLAEGEAIAHVHVGLDPDGSFKYSISRHRKELHRSIEPLCYSKKVNRYGYLHEFW